MAMVNLNEDSIALLKECDSGCKMATESMEQIGQFVSSTELSEVIAKYNKDHIALGEEIHQTLNQAGVPSQEPSPVAKAMSWLTAQVKMMMKGDTHQAASILTDGCNMGIKSLNEYRNKYTNADTKVSGICDKLIHMEQDFMTDLTRFL